MPKSLHAFDDPAVADTYADRAARFVPVYREIHRMAAVLMDEHAPQDARVLVLGAGGGLETKAFAQGYIDDAPPGPFDAATSLLTLHFIEHDERRRTAAEVRRRLAPGPPFVVMHLSFPQRDDAERQLWMRRHVANLVASGLDPPTRRRRAPRSQRRFLS